MACGGGDGQGVRLDGSPRYPDDEGVLTDLDEHELSLDGERTYRVSPRLVAFSTFTQITEPPGLRRGQYVQVGLEDDRVVWMAGVAAVIELDGARSVFYEGEVAEVDERKRLVFRDGTVLRLSDELAARAERGPVGAPVQARIDVSTRRVVDLVPR